MRHVYTRSGECHPFIFCLPICVYLSVSVSFRPSHFIFVVANRQSSSRPASLDCSEPRQSGVRGSYLWTITSVVTHGAATLAHHATGCIWCIVAFTRLSGALHSSRSAMSVDTFSAWSTSHWDAACSLETSCVLERNILTWFILWGIGELVQTTLNRRTCRSSSLSSSSHDLSTSISSHFFSLFTIII